MTGVAAACACAGEVHRVMLNDLGNNHIILQKDTVLAAVFGVFVLGVDIPFLDRLEIFEVTDKHLFSVLCGKDLVAHIPL